MEFGQEKRLTKTGRITSAESAVLLYSFLKLSLKAYFLCAPHLELPSQTLLLQLTRPRRPYGTQKVLLSAAPFLT